MPAPAIKLMADYHCWPIWRHDGEVVNLDPRELGLSEELACALDAWAATYDAHLNPSDPASTAWTEAEEHQFDTAGRRLCCLLADEVGRRFRVFYSFRCIPAGDLRVEDQPGSRTPV